MLMKMHQNLGDTVKAVSRGKDIAFKVLKRIKLKNEHTYFSSKRKNSYRNPKNVAVRK